MGGRRPSGNTTKSKKKNEKTKMLMELVHTHKEYLAEHSTDTYVLVTVCGGTDVNISKEEITWTSYADAERDSWDCVEAAAEQRSKRQRTDAVVVPPELEQRLAAVAKQLGEDKAWGRILSSAVKPPALHAIPAPHGYEWSFVSTEGFIRHSDGTSAMIATLKACSGGAAE